MKKIFKLEPAYKDYIWGGNKLKREYKLKIKTEIPDDSEEQLYSIINACFKSAIMSSTFRMLVLIAASM